MDELQHINVSSLAQNIMKYFHQFTTVLAVINKNLCSVGPVEIYNVNSKISKER